MRKDFKLVLVLGLFVILSSFVLSANPSIVSRIITQFNGSTGNVSAGFDSGQVFFYANYSDADLDFEENSTFKWWTNATVNNAGGARTATLIPLIYRDAAAYWSFDQNGGTGGYTDETGKGNTMLVQHNGGLVNNITGVSRGAIDFDTVSFVNASSYPISFAGNFTISLWTYSRGYISQASVFNTILALGNTAPGSGIADPAVSFFFNNNNITAFRITQNGSLTASGTANTGRWQHVAGVYDSTSQTASFYRDGVFVSSFIANIGDKGLAGIELRIGTDNLTNSRNFNGSVDEVAIYNRTLNAGEVMQLYQRQWYGTSPQLFLLQPFKDNFTWLNTSDHDSPMTTSNVSNASGVYAGTYAVNLTPNGFINYSGTGNFNEFEGTIEFWMKPAWNGNDGFDHSFFSAEQIDEGFVIKKGSGNNLNFKIGGIQSTYAASGWTADNWQFIAVTWNNYTSLTATYVNGTLVASSTSDFNVTNPTILTIGAQRQPTGQNTQFCNCTIAEFRISRKALTSQEINLTFSKGRAFYQNEYMLNSSNFGEGDALRVEYTPRDDTGAQGAAVNSSTLQIDGVIPTWQYGVNTDANGTAVNRSWLFINITASDNNPGQINATLVNGTMTARSQTVSVFNSSGFGNAFNFTGLVDDHYNFTASVCDGGGQCNTTTTRFLRVDNGIPTITVINYTDGLFLSSRDLKISARANDANLFRFAINISYANGTPINNNLSDNINTSEQWKNYTYAVNTDSNYTIEYSVNDDLTFSPDIPDYKTDDTKGNDVKYYDDVAKVTFTVTPYLKDDKGSNYSLDTLGFGKSVKKDGKRYKSDYELNLSKLPLALKAVVADFTLVLRVTALEGQIYHRANHLIIVNGNDGFYYNPQDIANLGFTLKFVQVSKTIYDIEITGSASLWLATTNLDPTSGGLHHVTVENTVVVDTTLPTVAILAPLASQESGDGVTLQYSFSDLYVDSCWFRVTSADGSSVLTGNTTIAGCVNTSFTASLGANRVYVYVNDTSGNVGERFVNFLVAPPSPPAAGGGGGAASSAGGIDCAAGEQLVVVGGGQYCVPCTGRVVVEGERVYCVTESDLGDEVFESGTGRFVVGRDTIVAVFLGSTVFFLLFWGDVVEYYRRRKVIGRG